MAIEELFTGKCSCTDEAGRGADDLIRDSAKEWEVTAECADVKLECRRNRAGLTQIVRSERGQAKEFQHLGKQAIAWITENIAPIDALSSVLNAHRFIGMTEKDQKALLAGALASDPVEIDKEILALMKQVGYQRVPTVSSAAEADNSYKMLFESRADLKRELKALGTPEEPQIPSDAPSLSDVQNAIHDREDELKSKERNRARLLMDVQERNFKSRQAYSSRHAALVNAQNLRAEYEPKVIETTEEMDNLQRQLKRKGEAAKLDTEIATIKAKQQALRDERAALTAPVETECPHCHRPYDNVLPDHSKRLAQIEKEANALVVSLQNAQDSKAKLPDFAAIERRLEESRKAGPKLVAAESEIKEIGELGPEPVVETADTSVLDEEIDDLARRISKGQSVREQVVRFEEQQKQYVSANTKRFELEKQINVLEQLVQYFGDKGPLKAKLVGGKLPAFRDRINQVLARFGFECQFEMEPYVLGVIQLGPNGEMVGRPHSLKQLSKSEQYRFGVAFQVALAESTGIGFVVIDEADILNGEARQQLTAELITSQLDQAIVLSTGEPLNEFPDIDDVAFFELEKVNGQTRIRLSHNSAEGASYEEIASK
jgi:hypothetical protein